MGAVCPGCNAQGWDGQPHKKNCVLSRAIRLCQGATDEESIMALAYAETRKVHGQRYCPRTCSECEGFHHWIPECPDPTWKEGPYADHPAVKAGHQAFYVCKHCDAWMEFE